MVFKIILVGYMGAGKSSVAKKLSKILNIQAFDLDELVENKLEMSINDIFVRKGELFFRKIEHEVFKEWMLTEDSFILSTGGGTPCYAGNHLFLDKQYGISFYLKSSLENLVLRLQNDIQKRPILHQNAGVDLHEFVAKHLFDRSYYYHQCQYILQTDALSIDEVANEIAKIVQPQIK